MTSSTLWTRAFIWATFFSVVAILGYWIASTEIETEVLSLYHHIALSGPLSPNHKLADSEKLSINGFSGPESIVMHNGELYTGVEEGWILKLNQSGIYKFARLALPSCSKSVTCSRPLGLRLSIDKEHLLVADAYLGIYSVSLNDGSFKKFPFQAGFRLTFFDDLDILPCGSVIVSEPSTKYQYAEFLLATLEGIPNGRVLLFNSTTSEWSILLDKLWFPNGIQLHRDGKSVLIAEATSHRILRLPLDGGPATIFANNLPGFPDNIRRSPRGGYWVALSCAQKKDKMILEILLEWPIVRRFTVRLLAFPPLRRLFRVPSTLILRLDEDGQILESLQDPSGTIENTSEVLEEDNHLYMGSFYLPYISRLKL